MIPFAIEALRGWKERSAGEGLLRVGAVFAPIVGVGIYLAWAGAAFDDPFGPFDVQQESGGRGAISNPVSTLIGAARSVFTDHHYHHGLHFIWALFFLALCVPLFRRWPISYGAFALVNIFQAIGTANLNSLERYGFAAFPLLLVVAEWSTESPVRSRAVVAISSVAMVMYATASFVSGYVP
jgi:hypothetical protein